MPFVDCGIDIGSTNLKVVLVEDSGKVLSTTSVPSPRVSDPLGPVTDAQALVGLLEQMIIKAWRDLGTAAPLRSIATAGVGEDGVFTTSGLLPTGNAIPWFDNRARLEAVELDDIFGTQGDAGIAIGPDRTVAKWLWLARNRQFERSGASAWIALTDYPAAWWTGRAFISASLAPRTAAYNVLRREWMIERLRAAHAPPLPEVLGAGTPLGSVRGGSLVESGAVSESTIVAVGGHDHPVAATWIRRQFMDGVVDSLGTANLLYGQTSEIPASPRQAGMAWSLPPEGGTDTACLCVLEFAQSLSQAEPDADVMRTALSKPVFEGIPPSNKRDLNVSTGVLSLRRAIERQCLLARANLDAMQDVGVPTDAVYTTGGWSRSRGLVQLRASIFGRSLRVIADKELSALGAAAYGAQAAGAQPGLILAEADIQTVEPVPSWADAYCSLYAEMRNSTD